MDTDLKKQIPTTILTGFLGAGKTSVLNRILKGNHGLKPAVLVNDFGKINIDAELIERIDDDGTVNLANGCICCSIRNDLISALTHQCNKSNPPDYIILECSGVSHTGEVITTFMSPGLKAKLKLDGIVAVVDSEQVRALTGKIADLARIQIELATVVILNKVDLVSDQELDKLKDWIRNISPQARILEAKHGTIPLEFILGIGNFDPFQVHKNVQIQVAEEKPRGFALTQSQPLEHVHPDHDYFSTFSYVTDESLDSSTFRKMIQRLPTNIYRAKGIINLEPSKENKYIFQIVGRWVSLTSGPKWGDQDRSTQIVMIGEKGKLDEIDLTNRINSCLLRNMKSRDEGLDREFPTREFSVG